MAPLRPHMALLQRLVPLGPAQPAPRCTPPVDSEISPGAVAAARGRGEMLEADFGSDFDSKMCAVYSC